ILFREEHTRQAAASVTVAYPLTMTSRRTAKRRSGVRASTRPTKAAARSLHARRLNFACILASDCILRNPRKNAAEAGYQWLGRQRCGVEPHRDTRAPMSTEIPNGAC